MTVVPPTWRARIAASLRAHHRLVASVALVVVVILVACEVGVRVIHPDAVEVIEYSNTSRIPSDVIYDHIITNPTDVTNAYQALTQTAEPWNTFDVHYGGLAACEDTHIMSPLSGDTNIGHVLVLRFLWHDLPIAVATHTPPNGNSGGPWQCEVDDWQVSAGGVVNPRPYIDANALSYFPTTVP